MQKPRWGGEKPSGPRRGRWSADEIARFRGLYGLRDDAAVARDLNRSLASVRNMAKSVFRGDPHSGPWTPAEVKELKRYFGATTLDVISTILGRSKRDIQARIAELRKVQKTGPWTQAGVNEFKRLYGTRKDEDLALIFGRKVESIRAQATKLCIAKDKAFLRKQSGGRRSTRMPRWGREELELLQELYPIHSNLAIAQRLERSVKSVVSKAHNLGLKKDSSRLRQMGRENVGLRYGKRQP